MTDGRSVEGSNRGDRDILKIVATKLRDSETRITAAISAVTADIDEMRTRVDATHSIMSNWHHVENSITGKMSALRLQMKDMQEAFKLQHTSTVHGSGDLQQLKAEILAEAMVANTHPASGVDADGRHALNELWEKVQTAMNKVTRTNDEVTASLSSLCSSAKHHESRISDLEASIATNKAEQIAWEESNAEAVSSMNALVTSVRSDMDESQQRLSDLLASMEQKILALQETVTKQTCEAQPLDAAVVAGLQAEMHAASERLDEMEENLNDAQESIQMIENSLSECLDEVNAKRKHDDFKTEVALVQKQLEECMEARLKDEVSRMQSDLASHAAGVEIYLKDELAAVESDLQERAASINAKLANEMACVRSDLGDHISVIEGRLKNGSKKLLEAVSSFGYSVEQPPEFHTPVASPRAKSGSLISAMAAPGELDAIVDKFLDQENRQPLQPKLPSAQNVRHEQELTS